MKKGLKESKSVSWASGAKLCQVKLFLSEDCPSKVGLQTQDHLQTNSVYSDNHSSRFEGRHSMDPLKKKLTHIPQIEWKCPPEVVLNPDWRVSAGEESEEAETQKNRERRVFRSAYTRVSEIHRSFFRPLYVQDHLDDSHIPVIPVTPIEDVAVDLPSETVVPQNTSFNSQPLALPRGVLSGNPESDPAASLKPSANEKPALEILPGFQADAVVAAVAAVTAITKSTEHASLIDPDLLIKFLSDPKMVEKLIREQGSTAGTKTEPVSESKSLTISVPLPITKPGLVEKVINENEAVMKTASTSIPGPNLVSPSVAIPGPNLVPPSAAIPGPTLVPPLAAIAGQKPNPVIKQLNNKQDPISGSKLVTLTPSVALPGPKSEPVIEKLIHKHRAHTETRAAPVSGQKPATSRVAFRSPRPGPVVKKLINENQVPTEAGSVPFAVGKLATPLASLPSSKPHLAKIKMMINEYGTENEPISRSMPLTLKVPISSPKLDMVLPDVTGPNLIALPNMIQPDLRLKAPSLDTTGLNLHPLVNTVQRSLQMQALSPDTVPTSTFLGPPVKDINYIKNLIRRHGKNDETEEYNLSQSGKSHVQDLKLVPNLKPNELTPKFQKDCIFFNSLRGCRNGSNCLFRHDRVKKLQPGSVLEGPSAKRMKLGGEITGST
ncbi:hypothetical protein ACSBR2_009575 [Camellia fascicularis]